MSNPFAPAPRPIPVTVVTRADALPPPDRTTTVLRLEQALHVHEAGSECIACAARSDIRALLFDLLQRSRQSHGNPLVSVLVDASELVDARPVIARLEPGTAPALGLRDHTVARSFHLARVI